MKKKQSSLPVVYVKPGEIYFSYTPEVIITVLGSCVAVVMYEPQKGICAISHGVLPTDRHYPSEGKDDFKFVDRSIHNMLELFDKNKIARNKITVKLFGGAEQLRNDNRRISVGKQNVTKAVELLEKEGLNISSMDVGGNTGRKIYLFSQSGEVLLSRLDSIKTSSKKAYEKDKSISC